MSIYVQQPPKKENETSIIHWIDVPPFRASIMFMSGFKFQEVIDHLKTLDDSEEWIEALSSPGEEEFFTESYMAASLRTVEKEGKSRKYFFIWTRDVFQFTDYEYCALAHEVVHICQFLLPTHCDRNKETEFEAYTHTYIMEECLKAIRS
jgi:hypothetical protein